MTTFPLEGITKEKRKKKMKISIIVQYILGLVLNYMCNATTLHIWNERNVSL